MFWISELRPAPPPVSHAKRTVKRTAWAVSRFKRDNALCHTLKDSRPVSRDLVGSPLVGSPLVGSPLVGS